MKNLLSNLRRETMPVVKIMQRRQVIIPKELFEKLHLEIGDYLEARLEGEKIVYIPKKLVDRDEWYWSEEGQKAIGEALKEIEEGKAIGPFETAEEAIRELNKHAS
jgi:AbrB family looped-hinge helix DNA binding protein